jgi:hypothetical protein
LWINLGPLLYHFSDLPNENSIEPSYQVVREVILGIGFEIEVCHSVHHLLILTSEVTGFVPLYLDLDSLPRKICVLSTEGRDTCKDDLRAEPKVNAAV